MSFESTAALGAIAGFTIFLGLPLGRLRILSTQGRVALAMFAVGILGFLLVEILGGAVETVEHALEDWHSKGEGSFGHVVFLASLLTAGFTLGSAGIGIFERRLRKTRAVPPPVAGGAAAEAFTLSERERLDEKAAAARQAALQTGLIIAAAIGVHNFAEGLAIGVSARAGDVTLATVLVIGFALHNSTEGFGIVGPLGSVVPSWRWLALAGFIGGAPTFLGSMLGYQVTSETLELACLGLAGGALFYVIGEIWHGTRRHGHRELGLLLLAAGFVAGLITELVIAYGSS